MNRIVFEGAEIGQVGHAAGNGKIPMGQVRAVDQVKMDIRTNHPGGVAFHAVLGVRRDPEKIAGPDFIMLPVNHEMSITFGDMNKKIIQ